MKTYLSWRDVLDCSKWEEYFPTINDFIEIANKLGYKAIYWNKFVWWKIHSDHLENEWVKSDKTIEDII